MGEDTDICLDFCGEVYDKIYQGRESPCPGCHTLETFENGEKILNQSKVTYEQELKHA